MKHSRILPACLVSLLSSALEAPGAQVLYNGATTTSSYAYHTFLDTTTAGTRAWVFKNSTAPVPALATAGELASVTPVGVLANGSPDLVITGAGFAGVGFYEWAGDPDQAARDVFSNGTGFYGDSITLSLPSTIAVPGLPYHVELLGQFGFSNDRRFNVAANGIQLAANWTILNSATSNSVLEFDIVPDAAGITLQLTRGTDAGVDTMPYVHAVAITPVPEPCSLGLVAGAALFLLRRRRP